MVDLAVIGHLVLEINLNFSLKNSKIVGQISHKKWTRPDITKNNENELVPDNYVKDDENILEKALEIIKSETETSQTERELPLSSTP